MADGPWTRRGAGLSGDGLTREETETLLLEASRGKWVNFRNAYGI
ncbi:MAG: hypothetical protein ACLU8D_00925 [Enterocloster sp.]